MKAATIVTVLKEDCK